jgi:hypothetical protein
VENICPVCNSLITEEFLCSNCGTEMNDRGRVEDYLDDYSADMPIEDEGAFCKHVYACSNCGNMKNINIRKVKG